MGVTAGPNQNGMVRLMASLNTCKARKAKENPGAKGWDHLDASHGRERQRMVHGSLEPALHLRRSQLC